MSHVLPPLPYAYEALEPAMDVLTVQIHHDKHHAAYVNNLNAALDKHPEWHSKSLRELMKNLSALPEDIRTAVRNNAGGVYNHNLYWDLMKGRGGGGQPTGALMAALEKTFGSFDAFTQKFAATAVAQFGSGWGWLCVNDQGGLCVCSTPGHDNPLMQGIGCPGTPILVVDVWEHAYYLKFQNRRADFVAGWWSLVDWSKVESLYQAAIKVAL